MLSDVLTRTPTPTRERIERSNIQERVIVVSPYKLINLFLDDFLPQLLARNTTVDIVSHAELDRRPYIDPEQRERDRSLPEYVIDFGELVVPDGENQTTAPFTKYREWAMRKERTLIIPRAAFSRQLEQTKIVHAGNFLSDQTDCQQYLAYIKKDLFHILDEFPNKSTVLELAA